LVDAPELMKGLDELAMKITKKGISEKNAHLIPWPYNKVNQKLYDMKKMNID